MTKQPVDFSSYTLADYIDHPDFVNWVTTPTPALDVFWEKVQEDYPSAKTVMAEARGLVLSLRFENAFMEEPEQKSLWHAIELEAKLNQKSVVKIPLWLRSAAAVLIFGLVGLSVFLYSQQSKITVSTAFAEVKTFTLPDGSVVTLNANSKLRYPEKWNTEKIREVWIEGEGFFKVNHLHQSGVIKEADRFIVHAEKLNVEVLGTTFNVNNRRGKISVALLTGKVGLELAGNEKAGIKLQPGELAEYEDKKKVIIKKKVQADDYVAWKSNKLYFDNTPLTDVLLLIEDNYGYKAVIKDAAVKNKKLSGTFSFSSEDALFKAIALSLGISIEKNQAAKEIIVR